MDKINYNNWEDLIKLSKGDRTGGITIEDKTHESIRYLIMCSGSSLCAYLGVPIDHPLANQDYNDVPLECHWGLTYGSEGDGDFRPENYYWYGWDYAHLHDANFYSHGSPTDKKWCLDDVRSEVKWAITDFKRLMKLAEINPNLLEDK